LEGRTERDTREMDVKRLREKATTLGFSFERGTRRGAGYVLVNDANGDRPLGADYTASLADVEKYLDNHADDLDVEMEFGDDTVDPKPPTTKEIKQALKGHSKADEIERVIDPPSPTKDQRIAEWRREIALLGTVGQRKAYERTLLGLPGGMSEEDAAQYRANSRMAKLEQEAIDAAEALKQKPQFFRVNDDTKISPDDPLFAEKLRWNNVYKNANKLLTRTSISSRRDLDLDAYEEDFYHDHRPPPDDSDSLPPEPGQSGP
jgi:hypothetical protein